jgi:23S rRNA A2030 N6-methylase RlmJ
MYIFKVDVKNYRFIENKNIALRRFQKNMSQKIRKCLSKIDLDIPIPESKMHAASILLINPSWSL